MLIQTQDENDKEHQNAPAQFPSIGSADLYFLINVQGSPSY